MKTLLAFACAVVLFGSCTKKVLIQSDVVGAWQRTETLIDPGNGSGQWQPVDMPERTIVQFKADGKLVSSNHWYLSRYNRFSVVSDSQLRLYTPANDSLTITYLLDDKLTLNFQCIEACRDRFTKVN